MEFQSQKTITHLNYVEELPIVEHFYTLQGEGAYAGVPAYFIRTAGCDVGCTWCDTKHSWEMDKHPKIKIKSLIEIVKQTPCKIAVITGGEPLMHNLTSLTNELKKNKLRCHIETSGAYNISGEWDWITLSPKKFKPALDPVIQHADELKIIVYNQHDLEWAQTFLPKIKKSCKLYLQPEYGKQHEILPLIIDFIKQNPEWQLSLQIHKILQIP